MGNLLKAMWASAKSPRVPRLPRVLRYLFQLSSLPWNRCPASLGITVQVPLESVSSLGRNSQGVAVLTMDPQNGPFTNIELESIQAALNKAYAAGNVSTDDYLLAWLFMLLGQRPAQYALLKVMDVLAPTVKDGSAIYILRMPRIKQQKQVHRTEFKERLITPQIGKLLNLYADEVKRRFEGILEDVILAPLFPETDSSGLQPAGMKFHKTSGRIANTLNNTLKGLDVFSERTGRRVHVTATRFRRTIGTRAAQEGHGELVIAELLDHTDTQNVGV